MFALAAALLLSGCSSCSETAPVKTAASPEETDSAPELGCLWTTAASGKFDVHPEAWIAAGVMPLKYEKVVWRIEIEAVTDGGESFGGHCTLDLDERTESLGKAAGWCINDSHGFDGRTSDGFLLHVKGVLTSSGMLPEGISHISEDLQGLFPAEFYSREKWRDAVDAALPGNVEFCRVRAVVEAKYGQGSQPADLTGWNKMTIPLEVEGVPAGANPFGECTAGICNINWDAWTKHVRGL
jgi:hypothetical protein